MPGDDPPHNEHDAQTSGLPLIAPDVIEEEDADEIDNIVPTRGYQMLPVVALGGSAGSIPALQKFFAAMPAHTGMAFVVVIHLAPENISVLDEIIGRATSMKVVEATDQVKVAADTVYIIPPGKFLSAMNGKLKLTPLEPEHGRRVAVDLFFRTLADTHGPNAAAIVLSGADGDGALGIKRIKERGGLTVAQDPEEAEHPGMPRTAIDTGMVDWVLPVEDMPERLVTYRENAKKLKLPSEDGPQPAKLPPTAPEADENALRDVLGHLRSRTGRDFSYYKRATIVRRISRRMQVNDIATLPEYLLYLRTHPGEFGALLQDLLISVTNFFRDREAFEALEARIPALIAGKGSADVVRVWSAGCATGEEAYSIAMLLLEQCGRMDSPPMIQVFATDLSEEVIAAARDGVYPFTITADVSEERLRRFFIKEHRGYRARRELRECVLFAVHDLLKDAPFSRLDLFTCRNLLIYLTTEAQKRVFDVAHFALRPGGSLFIGTSESVDEESPLWTTLDKKHRIFQQRPVARPGLPVPIGPSTLSRAIAVQDRAKTGPFLHGPAFSTAAVEALRRDAEQHGGKQVSWEELHYRLIERFAPPSIIVTQDHDIVHMSENAGDLLHFSGGEPSVNLLRVVHPMLRVELRAALFRAAQANSAVEVFRIPVELKGKTLSVDIRVCPAQEIAPDYLLVVFQVRETDDTKAVEERQDSEPAVRHLEREIEQMKSRLRDTVEQYEASSEELKASNEELQAMNEELRSSAEELETSREELQSVNEELSTLNQELKSKVDELGRSNADLNNLMAATGVATIFLDRSLCITRYTPTAVTLFRLIPSDLGRPLTDLNHRLNYRELLDDAQRVLEHLIPVKREVTDGQHWYLAQLLPYRTSEDRIAGVVLSFVDITEARAASEALLTSEEQLRLILQSATDYAIFTLDLERRVKTWNSGAQAILGYESSEVIGQLGDVLFTAEDQAKGDPQKEAEKALREGRAENERWHVRKDGSTVYGSGLNMPLRDGSGAIVGFVKIMRDLTEQTRTEEAFRIGEEQFRRAIQDAPIPVIMHAEDGEVLQISRTWTELTGYTQEDLPRLEAWLSKAYGPGTGILREQIRKLFQGETRLQEVELEVTTADGERRNWIFTASAPGALRDGRRFIVAMALDITDRKRAEEALRESQERLRLVIENATDYAIFSMDLERRVTTWNPGAQELLGYAEQEIIGQYGDIIFTPEDREKGAPVREAEVALFEGRAADERWHMRKDGSLFWGSGVMSAMRDEEGKAIGLVKIFRDQTEQRNAQQALEKSQEELWEALKETEQARAAAEAARNAKDHFLAVLSHELRTPLTPVIMAVNTLGRRKDLPPLIKDALTMIDRNIQLEARFIDDLLDLTRIERGKLELDRQPLDLHAVIREAAEVVGADIEAKKQRLTIELAAEDSQIEGDRLRLQQVFWNLLKNAAKFSSDGGMIALYSRNVEGRVMVTVTDDGIGFEPEAAERLFEAFQQSNVDVTRKYGGLGLGLAIAQAVVEGHEGTLTAQSDGPGKGATFTVSLPLSGGTTSGT